MKTKIKKLKTDDSDLIFIGYKGNKEFYINSSKSDQIYGLRSKTEQELRASMRNIEPEEYGIDLRGFELYFDYEKWYEDKEEEWYDFYEVQAKRENEEGETLYLYFDSSSPIYYFLKENNIKDYESYCEHFEFVGLTEKEFNEIFKDYIK